MNERKKNQQQITAQIFANMYTIAHRFYHPHESESDSDNETEVVHTYIYMHIHMLVLIQYWQTCIVSHICDEYVLQYQVASNKATTQLNWTTPFFSLLSVIPPIFFSICTQCIISMQHFYVFFSIFSVERLSNTKNQLFYLYFYKNEWMKLKLFMIWKGTYTRIHW